MITPQNVQTLCSKVEALRRMGVIDVQVQPLLNHILGRAPDIPEPTVPTYVYYTMLFHLSHKADSMTIFGDQTTQHKADRVYEFVSRNMRSQSMRESLRDLRSRILVMH